MIPVPASWPREDRLTLTLANHQLEEPHGGTAWYATCACSCGYEARIRGGLRDQARRAAERHVAQIIEADIITPAIQTALRKARP